MISKSTILAVLLPIIGCASMPVENRSIDWIAGYWCADFGDTTVEEFWLPAHGGVTIGIGRTLSPGRTSSFEYLRIVDRDGVQSYIAQPGGRPATEFRRTAGGADWVRFENPDHDFPQRVEYRREGDSLHAQVGGPGEDGEESVIAIEYRRCESGNVDRQ